MFGLGEQCMEEEFELHAVSCCCVRCMLYPWCTLVAGTLSHCCRARRHVGQRHGEQQGSPGKHAWQAEMFHGLRPDAAVLKTAALHVHECLVLPLGHPGHGAILAQFLLTSSSVVFTRNAPFKLCREDPWWVRCFACWRCRLKFGQSERRKGFHEE